MATIGSTTEILERVKVREVAGVFRSRDALDAAATALLSSGFDRADVDIIVGVEAREGLGGAKIAAEELPEVLAVPRQPVIARGCTRVIAIIIQSVPRARGSQFDASHYI